MLGNIKILNINCQSFSAKKDKFLTVIEDENPDIVVGTESWLTPNRYSGEIFPQQYQVFRKDRKSGAHRGVFITTKLDLLALLREDLSHPNSELLWVQLQCHAWWGPHHYRSILRISTNRRSLLNS